MTDPGQERVRAVADVRALTRAEERCKEAWYEVDELNRNVGPSTATSTVILLEESMEKLITLVWRIGEERDAIAVRYGIESSEYEN